MMASAFTADLTEQNTGIGLTAPTRVAQQALNSVRCPFAATGTQVCPDVLHKYLAPVVKEVDTRDLKSLVARRAGSSPARGTIFKHISGTFRLKIRLS